jgi:SAM-dependent methyltransferase
LTQTPAYDRIGEGYSAIRQPEPRFTERIQGALVKARTVVNVGAGAGSYEPAGRGVVAVEPSELMIAQRPPHAARVVQAHAELLPFKDASFDAAMAVLSVHHWDDLEQGIAELRRVARSTIVILTLDPEAVARTWLAADYFPEAGEISRRLLPEIAHLEALLPDCAIETIPAPHACRDRFAFALWDHPHEILDPEVRRASSIWHEMPAAATERGLARLRADLGDGTWHKKYADMLDLPDYDIGLRLLVWER